MKSDDRFRNDYGGGEEYPWRARYSNAKAHRPTRLYINVDGVEGRQRGFQIGFEQSGFPICRGRRLSNDRTAALVGAKLYCS